MWRIVSVAFPARQFGGSLHCWTTICPCPSIWIGYPCFLSCYSSSLSYTNSTPHGVDSTHANFLSIKCALFKINWAKINCALYDKSIFRVVRGSFSDKKAYLHDYWKKCFVHKFSYNYITKSIMCSKLLFWWYFQRALSEYCGINRQYIALYHG